MTNTEVREPSAAVVVETPVTVLTPADDNLRTELGDLTDLAESIKAHGIIEPIKVVPAPAGEVGFRIVDGHRRFAAAELAGMMTVPTLMRSWDDRERLSVMLVTALHREDLTPLEEAGAYRTLKQELGMTQTEIAQLASRSEAHISKRLSLLVLPKPALDALSAGKITLDTAYGITGLVKHKRQLDHVLQDLTDALEHDDTDRTVARAVAAGLRQAKNAEQAKALKAEWTAKGATILKDLNTKGYRHAERGETPEAVHISPDGLYVTKFMRDHTPRPEPKAKPKPTPTAELETTEGDEAARERQARREQLNDQREAFCVALVAKTPASTDVFEHALRWQMEADDPGDLMSATLLLELGKKNAPDTIRELLTFARRSLDHRARVCLAWALSIGESITAPAVIDGEVRVMDADDLKLHLAFLEAQGYELDDDERALLADD